MIFSMLLIWYKLCDAYCVRCKSISGHLSCFWSCDDNEEEKENKSEIFLRNKI